VWDWLEAVLDSWAGVFLLLLVALIFTWDAVDRWYRGRAWMRRRDQ
jgi:hypothetical protein